MKQCYKELFQNIPQHQSLEELSLSLASSWLSLYQLQGLLVDQFQLTRQSFADQLEVICEQMMQININFLWTLLTLCTAQGISPRKLPKSFSGVQELYHS